MLSMAVPHQATISNQVIVINDEATYQLSLSLNRRLDAPFIVTVTAWTLLGKFVLLKEHYQNLTAAREQITAYVQDLPTR